MMALVRVVSRRVADPYQDCKLMKRGDVIAVGPDTWPWSPIERTHIEWRLFTVTGISDAEIQAWTVGEKSQTLQESRMLRKRAFYLDLDALPAASIALIDAVPRNDAPLTFTRNQMRQIVTEKTPLPDPGVIGDTRVVIG